MITRLIHLAGKALYKKLFSRHFALFLLPWLIVLAVPPLRLMLSVQVLGSPVGALFIPNYSWTPGGYDHVAALPATIAELKQAYPDDVRVQLLAAATAGVPDESTRLKQYDALIRRYPAEVWLVAWRLQETTLFEENAATAIATARLGRSREPQNAFFDLVLMQSLFLAHREEEALEVLKEAARKPYFDTRLRHTALSYIAAYELARPLLYEEKIEQMRNVLAEYRAPVWDSPLRRALQERQRGNHARALQIYGDLTRLAGKLRDNPDDIYSDESRQNVIWAKAVDGTPHGRPRLQGTIPHATRTRLQAKRFAAYARQHGRADLAAEAMREAEATIAGKQRRDLQQQEMQQMAYHYESLPHSLRAVSWQPVTDRWIMAMGVGGCLLLVLCLRLLLFFPLWTPGLRCEPVRIRDRWATLLWCIVATTIVSAYAVVGIPFLKPRSHDEAIFLALSLYFPSVLFVGAIICAAMTVCTNRLTIFRARPPEPGFHAGHVPRSLIPPFLTAISWALFVPAIVCWIVALIIYFQPNSRITIPLPAALSDSPANTTATLDYGWFLVGGIFLSLVSYIGWLIRWRWLTPHDLKPISHYALRWHLLSLGDWVIVLSFAYLVIAVSSLAPRREADAALQRFLQQNNNPPRTVNLHRQKTLGAG